MLVSYKFATRNFWKLTKIALNQIGISLYEKMPSKFASKKTDFHAQSLEISGPITDEFGMLFKKKNTSHNTKDAKTIASKFCFSTRI